MLALLKRNDIVAIFSLLLFTCLFRVKLFVSPPSIQFLKDFHRTTFFAIDWLPTFYQNHTTLYLLISTIISFVFALYINMVLIRQKLFHNKSFVPAFAFMFYSSFIAECNVFTMPYLSAILAFVAFANALELYHLPNARKHTFNIGFFASLAMIVYFPTILFFILFLILILLFRAVDLREIVAFILGYLTPIYFALGIGYLLTSWAKISHSMFLHLELPLKTQSFLSFGILTAMSLILLVYGLYLNNTMSLKNSMAVRKKWYGITWYFIFAALAGIFTYIFPSYNWIIAIIPFSIILSHCFINNKEKINNFTLYLMIIVLIYMQWFL